MEKTAVRRRSLRAYLDLVRFEHTLFALPFAYAGMLLAAGGWPGWGVFGWVTAAMAGARTAAMALNRLIDARIDAANPRTAGRELPTGTLGRGDAIALALAGLVLLVASGLALNPLTAALLPVAVAALALYSYTKRFTWLCHVWLGATIGAAAAGGWIAVTGEFAAPAVLLWAGVGWWIAGFDIVYALLDHDFDVRNGVRSIPARFGPERARRIAVAFHVLSLASLAALVPVTELDWPFGIALAAIAAVLLRGHALVRLRGAAAALAAFDSNLYVSSLALAGIVADLALG